MAPNLTYFCFYFHFIVIQFSIKHYLWVFLKCEVSVYYWFHREGMSKIGAMKDEQYELFSFIKLSLSWLFCFLYTEINWQLTSRSDGGTDELKTMFFFQEDLWCYLKLLLFCCLLSVAPTNVACRKFTDDWSNSLTANYIDSCPVLSRCHLCTVCRNVCRVFFILQLLWIAHPWCNYFCLCFPGAVPRV